MAELDALQGKKDYAHIIKIGGAALDKKYQLLTVRVVHEINRIPFAELEIVDGDIAKETFEASASSDFDPGKEIQIDLGHTGSTTKVFKGIITRHALKIRRGGGSVLVVEARDKALKMTVVRKNAFFEKKTDSKVISTLISDHGLTNDVTATSVTFPKLMQYQATDWDFMLTRAEVNGFVVTVEDGKVTVGKPAASKTGTINIKYGRDIIEMDTELDARYQYKDVSSTAWDHSQQQVVTASSSEPTVNSQGSVTGSTLADVLSSQTFNQYSPIKATNAYLKAWADAQLQRARLSRVKGRMKIIGLSDIKINTTVKLANLGAKFNGSAYVSGVRHQVERNIWTTELNFGIDSQPFAEKNQVNVAPASGMLPAVSGLQIGVVTSIEDDTGEFLVTVDIPYLGDTIKKVVARLAHIYASNASGIYFMPEVGDEVVLGFMNEDPNYPVILGSMHSSKNASPETPEKKNDVKAIITKSKMKISFKEEDKIITIETPGANKITISDKDKSITIQDQNNNKIELAAAGITLNSAKDVIIKAQGKVSIEAQMEIGLIAQTDVKVAGMNITNEAQVKFSGKGNAQAELVASGQTTVKGAMVMIN